MESVVSGIDIGLMYVPLALAGWLILRVLGLPDLTIEGSFGVASAVTAVLLSSGWDPYTAVIGGVAAGALMGLVTATLHLVLRMSILLASLLVMTAALSIALAVQSKRASLPLLDTPSVFDWGKAIGLGMTETQIISGVTLAAVLIVALIWFFSTSYGLSLRAGGLSIHTARGFGIRTETRQVVGLMVANALAGLSGALIVQYQRFTDVSLFSGVFVIAIAALMIAQAITRSERTIVVLLAVVAGILAYNILISVAISLGADAIYIKAITSLLVIGIIAVRNHGEALLALPGTARALRRRRERTQFFEDDHIVRLM